MAGHSKWAQIKHKKAGSDSRRGALFSKLSRMIGVAAREGPDPRMNARLRQTIERAREAGMPKENIERAIARAGGGDGSPALDKRTYEAYGPGGSAFLIQAVSDNPNRTSSEVKKILADFGGKLAAAGSVEWMFERRIAAELIAADRPTEETELILIDAGAEETAVIQNRLRAIVPPEAWEKFERALSQRGLTPTVTEHTWVATNTAALGPEDRVQAAALGAALMASDDVTGLWTNISP